MNYYLIIIIYKKMNFLTLVCFKSYWYFIVYWVFSLIASVLLFLFYVERDKKTYLREERYIILLQCSISYLLAGILVLITKHLIKSTKKVETKANNDIKYELIYNDKNEVYLKKNSMFLILLIGIIEFDGQAIDLIYTLIFEVRLDYSNSLFVKAIEIISRIIFSIIFLNLRIYKHHIVAIVILIIGFLPLIIAKIFFLTNQSFSWHDFLNISLFFLYNYNF